MNEKGTSYNIAKLQESDEVYTIKEGDISTYDPNTMTISWNPNIVAKDSGTKLLRSPVTSLCHEAGHAVRHDTAIKEGKLDAFAQSSILGSDKQYDTVADKDVITTTEQYAARQHGEISDGQVTRTGHEGKSFQNVPFNGKEINLSTKTQSWISLYVGAYNRRIKK